MSGFWLRIKRFNTVRATATRSDVVGAHHPLIMKFLRSKVQSYLEQEQHSAEHNNVLRVGNNDFIEGCAKFKLAAASLDSVRCLLV